MTLTELSKLRLEQAAETGIKALLGGVVSFFLGLHYAIQLLLVAILGDILTGLLSAFITNKVSSDVSRKGMTKKALMLILVALSEVVSQVAGVQAPTPWGEVWSLGALAASYYAVSEAISITENVVKCGVPVPRFITRMLTKLKELEDNDQG